MCGFGGAECGFGGGLSVWFWWWYVCVDLVGRLRVFLGGLHVDLGELSLWFWWGTVCGFGVNVGVRPEIPTPKSCMLGLSVHQVKFGAPRRKETDPLNEPVRGLVVWEGWFAGLGGLGCYTGSQASQVKDV